EPVSSAVVRASTAGSSAEESSSTPVISTRPRSYSLASRKDRFSSVSKTSFNAARKPPKRRGGKDRDSGEAERGRVTPGPARRATAAHHAGAHVRDVAHRLTPDPAGHRHEAAQQLRQVELLRGELVLHQ